MFLKDDIYTSSGTTKLYHCWTDKVTKFDSSSFYNWEQDNLPIYDLDERTNFLWEQLGYPTSSIGGVALVVSADASDNDVACNKNIFRTVSAAIEALPQCINFPVLIEIANFGNLGDIVISNRRFGPNGSLEIINRNFARQENTFASGVSNFEGLIPPLVGVSSTDANNTFLYLSSIQANAGYYDSSSIKMSPLQGFLDASCISISAAVFSGTRDSRLSGTGTSSIPLNAYISVTKSGGNYNRATLVIDDFNDIQPYGSNNYDLNFKSYDLNPDSFENIQYKDASTLNFFNNELIFTKNNYSIPYDPLVFSDYSAYNGLYYGNKANKIFINNCDGKIFIRNFFVYGGGRLKEGNNYGVEVNNSPNVYLENMVVTKFRKAGFNFNNSRVTLLRGCVATRIYDYDSSGFRKTDDYENKRKFLTFNTSSSLLYDDPAAGLLANNSNITISSTDAWELPMLSQFLNPVLQPSAAFYIPNYYIFEFTKNANGIILNNSTLEGGKSLDTLRTYPTLYEITLDSAHNTGIGLVSNNSKVSIDGKIRFIENLFGAQFNNSLFEYDRIACIANQKQAISSYNSKIIYNKNFTKNHVGGSLWFEDFTAQSWFVRNGQHLVLNNSIMMPVTASSMEENYGVISFQDSMGKLIGLGATEGLGVLEGVRLQNNSDAVLISPQFERSNTYSIQSGGDPVFSKKGSELLITNNSKATLKGTRYFCTKAVGPTTYGNSKPLIALCADNNSMLQINGPTAVVQFGVGMMADSNSKLLLSAPRQLLDNSLDISSINLSHGGNHTAVEIHSIRTGIVANNNSIFEAKDLGSFITSWERKSTVGLGFSGWVGISSLSSVTNLRPEYYYNALDTEMYTSAGSLQFYPNPIARVDTNGYIGSIKGVNQLPNQSNLSNKLFTYDSAYGNYFLLANNNNPFIQNGVSSFSGLTHGGVCVRVLNNSIVNIKNVNFPCGYWNASAPYYDGTLTISTSSAPYKTFIWNISDDSQFKASYISVSSLFPRLAGYNGPLGFWGSGINASSLNYGLPSSTPDTSSLSILDLFGANPSSTAYSVSSHKNYGPFRLYLSVDPIVNSLVDVATLSGYGIIPQLYSQGYQPSSDLLCSGSPSSLYLNALQRNSLGSIVPSGYYYSKDIVSNPYNARIVFDESAAETFANAKHCASSKSNLAKTVNIYYPYHGDSGGIIKFGDSAILYGLGSLNIFDPETIG